MGDLPNAPKPKQGLPTIVKVLLGCGCLMAVVVGGVFGVGVYLVKKAMDPAFVSTVSDRALPGAKAPAGYKGLFGADLLKFRLAVFGPERADLGAKGDFMKIVVVQPPGLTEADRGKLRVKADEALESQGQGSKLEDVETLGTEALTVRGKPVDFQKMRGKDQHSGTVMLNYVSMLDGNGGLVILVFQGPEATFDRAAMDAFLASIR